MAACWTDLCWDCPSPPATRPQAAPRRQTGRRKVLRIETRRCTPALDDQVDRLGRQDAVFDRFPALYGTKDRPFEMSARASHSFRAITGGPTRRAAPSSSAAVVLVRPSQMARQAQDARIRIVGIEGNRRLILPAARPAVVLPRFVGTAGSERDHQGWQCRACRRAGRKRRLRAADRGCRGSPRAGSCGGAAGRTRARRAAAPTAGQGRRRGGRSRTVATIERPLSAPAWILVAKGPALRPQWTAMPRPARRRPAHSSAGRPASRGAAAGACPGHARSHLPAELTDLRDRAIRRLGSAGGHPSRDKSRLRPWRRKRAPRDRCIRGRRAASGRGPGGRPSVDNRTGRRRWRGWCCGTSPRARRPRAPSASGSSFAGRGPPPGWSPSGRAGGLVVKPA